MQQPSRRTEAVLWISCGVLGISLLYVILLNKWGVLLWDDKVDFQQFGNWSDAISGIATTAAVIVALATLYWQRVAQRDSDAYREVTAETAIFQWTTSKEIRDNNDSPIGRLWDLRIQNTTASPICRWLVSFPGRTEHLCSATKRPLLPGENIFNLPFLDNILPSEAPEPTLVFQGSSGRLWSRSATGKMNLVEAQEFQCQHLFGVRLNCNDITA